MNLEEDLSYIASAIDDALGEGTAKANPSLVGSCLLAFVLSGELGRLSYAIAEAGSDLACALGDVSPLSIRVVREPRVNGGKDE